MTATRRHTANAPTRIAVGVGAATVLIGVLAGVPIFLVASGMNPFPTTGQWAVLLGAQPDWGNQVLLTKLLPGVAWVAWLLFAIPWTLELATQLSGRSTRPRMWLFRGQQQIGILLIGAVLVMLPGVGTDSSSASASAPATNVAARAMVLTRADNPITAQAAQRTDRPSKSDLSYQVRAGDTLWDLAEQHLGSGAAYPEIVKDSADILQPAGKRLTDPDLILPGWRLEIPTEASDQRQDVDTAPRRKTPDGTPGNQDTNHQSKAPSSAPVRDPWAAGPTTSVSAPPASIAESSRAGSAESNEDDVDAAMLVNSTVPVLGFLAAGLVALIAASRLRQRRTRRPGERITMPPADAARAEQFFRAVEDPLNAAHLDIALRTIGAWTGENTGRLPDLLAVRAHGASLSFYFQTPTELPPPFVPAHEDRTAWHVEANELSAPSTATFAPYPALVTIGTDITDAVLLLNLEQLGTLQITDRDQHSAHELLTAIILEVATNAWSRDVTLTLSSDLARLGERIQSDRIRVVDSVDELHALVRAEITDRRNALASYAVPDVSAARASGAGIGTWGPHLVVVPKHANSALFAELAKLAATAPGSGVILLTSYPASEDGPIIDISSSVSATYRAGSAEPLLLPFTPQLVGSSVEHLLDSLVAGPQRTAGADEIPPNIDRDAPEGSDTSESDVVGADEASTEASEAPYVRLLGPIDALNVSSSADLPSRGLELLAYLHTQGGAVSGAQVQAALWPDAYDPRNNNTRTLAKQVRSALGVAADGDLFLPEGRRGTGFGIHPAISSDWLDFQTLVSGDLEHLEDSTLIAALRLVRGAPFTGTNRRRGWWAWRAPLEEEMIASVLDVADELADRALRRSDQHTLRFAARIAQTVDPLNEAGWRIELSLALAKGDDNEFDRVVTDIYAQVGGGDPDYVVDESTQELIEQARTIRTQRRRLGTT